MITDGLAPDETLLLSECSGEGFDTFSSALPVLLGAWSDQAYHGQTTTRFCTNQRLLRKPGVQMTLGPIYPPTMGSLGKLVNSSPVRLAVPSPRTLRPSPHLDLRGPHERSQHDRTAEQLRSGLAYCPSEQPSCI